MNIQTARMAGFALLLSSIALALAANSSLEAGQNVLANFELFVSFICFTNGAYAVIMTNSIK